MPERPSSDPVSTKLQRIAELARQAPDMVFTTLAHHIDIEFLLEACRRTRKDGAVGVVWIAELHDPTSFAERAHRRTCMTGTGGGRIAV